MRVCMDCGRPAEDTPLSPHHLAQRCVLIGKYLIVKSIGEGGFGITYLAWDLLRGVKVAIKEYYPNGYVSRMPRSNQVVVNSKSHQAASARSLKRFIDEAKMLTKVKNLNGIVSVKDFFSANGTAYIVMEFVDGISLKAYIKRKGGKLPMNDIVILLTPLIEGLKEIHALGLIHRDISPDNILITKEGDVKLIDFGAAKASHSDGQQLSIVLKQGFAPEEQYRSRSEQGPYTDIYALAVTIYYAITGQLPP
ncbi:MAG: serine/threonine protein kinase, partial [Firmicutes bacterium]|nr:serine/threonine protein kinase [Bacillota bacterium]